jgi:hypothetical protein
LSHITFEVVSILLLVEKEQASSNAKRLHHRVNCFV